MQHTDKYQLNLIETSDTFSPAPLNENVHKLEAELARLDAADAAGAADDAALDARLTVLEQPRVACGKFKGNTSSSNGQDLLLPFQPEAVFVFASNGPSSYMGSYLFVASEDITSAGGIIPGGFRVRGIMNSPDHSYYYLALA